MGALPSVKCFGIQKEFSGQVVLVDINISLSAGVVTGLLGGNGSGKTTLLKLLTGELRPTHGLFEIDGQRVEHLSYKLALDYGIVALYQDLALCPQMSVVDNIFLGREWRRASFGGSLGLVDRTSMEQEADRRFGLIGLSLNDVRKPVSRLSGGQRQATAFARLFDPKWRIFLLDEPTSALSEDLKANIWKTVKGFAEKGHAVLYISHDVEELEMVADRIITLQRGIIVNERYPERVGS
jgi:ABC-type sugar transport system ATPase subunit